MDDDLANDIWQKIWLAVAMLGLAGVILGNPHHIVTFIVGIILAIVAGRKDDNNQLKPR